jgi:hypothetical protein
MLREHENLRETRPSTAVTTWDKLLERVAVAA